MAFLSINLFYIGGVILILLVLALIIKLIIAKKAYQPVLNWFSGANKHFKALLFLVGIGKKDANKQELDESFAIAGYAYDEKQDIFYSIKDPWQRNFGYCRLYDEAAAPLGMIADCEPIYFEYNGKKWLVEFWKGQYDLPTGAEVGIYSTDGPNLNIPGFFNGTFYNCASEDEFLWMSFSLKKKGKILFERGDRHWWLTGFRLGEYSEPSELTLEITITLKDWMMCTAFIGGLKNAGYSDKEIKRYANTVRITFDKPHTHQPLTRTEMTDAIIQRKNRLLCDLYNEVTRGCITLEDKMKAVREQAPELYKHIMGLGRPMELYGSYEKIQRYLNK